MIPVRVISLERERERRARVAAELARCGVLFSWFDAIDGAALTEAEATQLCPHRASLTRRFITSKGEIACLESHKACLRAAARSSAPFTCILEDDAALDPDFPELLEEAWLNSLGDFDVLKLGGDGAKRKDEMAVVVGQYGKRQVCAPLNPTYSAIAYVVSRRGAARLARSSAKPPRDRRRESSSADRGSDREYWTCGVSGEANAFAKHDIPQGALQESGFELAADRHLASAPAQTVAGAAAAHAGLCRGERLDWFSEELQRVPLR